MLHDNQACSLRQPPGSLSRACKGGPLAVEFGILLPTRHGPKKKKGPILDNAAEQERRGIYARQTFRQLPSVKHEAVSRLHSLAKHPTSLFSICCPCAAKSSKPSYRWRSCTVTEEVGSSPPTSANAAGISPPPTPAPAIRNKPARAPTPTLFSSSTTPPPQAPAGAAAPASPRLLGAGGDRARRGVMIDPSPLLLQPSSSLGPRSCSQLLLLLLLAILVAAPHRHDLSLSLRLPLLMPVGLARTSPLPALPTTLGPTHAATSTSAGGAVVEMLTARRAAVAERRELLQRDDDGIVETV